MYDNSFLFTFRVLPEDPTGRDEREVPPGLGESREWRYTVNSLRNSLRVTSHKLSPASCQALQSHIYHTTDYLDLAWEGMRFSPTLLLPHSPRLFNLGWARHWSACRGRVGLNVETNTRYRQTVTDGNLLYIYCMYYLHTKAQGNAKARSRKDLLPKAPLRIESTVIM